MRTLICGALVAALLTVAGEAAADPRGLWLTEGGKSHVRLHSCEHNKKLLCGEIVWLRKPRKDVENDDKSLRGRPLVGIMAVWDLEHQGGADWDDGSIYNPEDGETYDSELEELDADTVNVLLIDLSVDALHTAVERYALPGVGLDEVDETLVDGGRVLPLHRAAEFLVGRTLLLLRLGRFVCAAMVGDVRC